MTPDAPYRLDGHIYSTYRTKHGRFAYDPGTFDSPPVAFPVEEWDCRDGCPRCPSARKARWRAYNADATRRARLGLKVPSSIEEWESWS